MKKSSIVLGLAIACFLIFYPVSAQAFRVTPMIVDLSPSGSRASTTVRIENTGPREIPVEVRVEKRVINEDGSETRSPADDDFLVFPPQAVINPGSAQALRVQYVGDPALASSQSYLVTVAQVPVQFEEEQSGIQFAFEFGVSVNVVPEQAVPQIRAQKQNANGQGMEILVENVGNAYARLSTGRWIFTNAAGEQHILQGEPLRAALQQPLIQPQSRRRIVLPVPSAFSAGEVQIIYEPA